MSQVTQKIADIWHSKQVVRYAVCGGGNMVFDWILYFLIYNFVIGHEMIYVRCTMYDVRCTMYDVRSMRGVRQLMRYILIVAVNLAVNYLGLKLCVENFGWYPTPSKMLITIVTVIISYLGQKYYTFKVKS